MLLAFSLLLVGPLAARSDLAIASLMFIGPLVLTFKHGSVRQPAFFFPFAIALCGVLLLVSRTGRERALLAGCVALVSAITIMAGSDGQRWLRRESAVVTAAVGYENLRSALNSTGAQQWLAKQGEDALAVQRLPSHWLEQLSEPGKTVDVMPWELSYIFANGLVWAPNPMVQTFMGYTAELGRVNAGHFAGDQAPEFILMEWIDLDGRHPLAGTPATWQAVLRHYDMVRVLTPIERAQLRLASPFPLALLERRAAPRDIQVVERETGIALLSESISVPRSESMLFLEVDLRLSMSGSFMKLASQIPAVSIRCFREDGSVDTFRVTPDTLRNGLLLHPLARGPEEFRVAADRLTGARVTAVAFEGPGLSYYSPTYQYRWLASAHTLANGPPRALEGAYVADYAAAVPLERLSPREQRTYAISVTNRGTRPWFHAGPDAVSMGVRFAAVDAAPNPEQVIEERFPLGRDVLPGETVTLSATVVAPPVPGAYTLRHRLLGEGGNWSDQVYPHPVVVR